MVSLDYWNTLKPIIVSSEIGNWGSLAKLFILMDILIIWLQFLFKRKLDGRNDS